MINVTGEFDPDYAQESPGTYLEWILAARGIKKVELAKRCGRPTKTISEIISGKASITPDTAIQFERVLGIKASVWLRLEGESQLSYAKTRARELDMTEGSQDWVRRFPLKEMFELGFLDKPDEGESLVDRLLKFFRVSSVGAWNRFWEDRLDLAHLKQAQHHAVDDYAVAAWINKGERIAETVETAPYDESRFKETLVGLRALTSEPWGEVESLLLDRCSRVGVAVALVPHLKKTGLRGAAMWATKDKAVILLSDRGKSQASVWFAFFHEAAHILLHSKKAIFIDQDFDGSSDQGVEQEADAYSAELLVPERELEKLLSERPLTPSDQWLEEAAQLIGVGPDLLLARLQHEGLIDHGTRLNKRYRRSLNFSTQ